MFFFCVGQPMKFRKIIRQNGDGQNYFASLVINNQTDVESIDDVGVTFKRIEPEITYIELDKELEVGALVSVNAKIDLSHAVEKNVHIGMKNATVLNQAIVYNKSGSAELALWEGWIDFIRKELDNNHEYYSFKNLLVKEFSGNKFLSTCSESEIRVICEEPVPDIKAPSEASSVEAIEVDQFDLVQEVQHYYECLRCSKPIRMVADDLLLVKCECCSATVRTAGLIKSIFVIIQSKTLGEDLYRFDASDLNAFGAPFISLQTDKADIVQRVMQMKGFIVFVDRKSEDNVVSIAPKQN